ncbi:uncharacterized protein LOC124420148 [Lucilia cuprina]|uniref:uncharacterized protein LOC124420148 n=1 Tax=Lucilia cuprina TaxID=7375 RepID=UPI001F06CFA4|nr:uncharacterized protein LOC124420148 [Lucilia cuprina]
MLWYKLLLSGLIYGLLILPGNQAKNIKKRGVMDNLNDGLKVAGQMFGINTAADVANLVAKAFSKNTSNRNTPDLFTIIQKGLQLSPSHTSSSEERKQNNYESQESQQQVQTEAAAAQFKPFQTKTSEATPSKESIGLNFGTTNLITSMLRMVGFDAAKLGALAINALIMIASAIGNTLMGKKTAPISVTALDGGRLFNRNPSNYGSPKSQDNPTEEENADNGPEEKYTPNAHQPRTVNDPTTIEWFLQNSSRKMKRVLQQATNSDLAEKLTDMITNYESTNGQAACLKMLVCKSSPFIWGMQKSIKKHIEPKSKEADIAEENEDNVESSFFNVQHFFTHLPSIDEYRAYGSKCEKQYSVYCNTKDLYNK